MSSVYKSSYSLWFLGKDELTKSLANSVVSPATSTCSSSMAWPSYFTSPNLIFMCLKIANDRLEQASQALGNDQMQKDTEIAKIR